MDLFYVIMTPLLVGISIGSFGGYGAGRAAESHRQHNARMAAITGGPRYSRNLYTVRAPNGMWIDTPSRKQADAFALKHGGDVRRSE